MSEDRRSAGRKLRIKAQGEKTEALQAALEALDPGLARWGDEFVFGEVWSRGELAFEERQLIALTALAMSNRPQQLRTYLHGALQQGIAEEKIHETLVMTCVYAGFPTAIGALVCWKEVLASHHRHED